MLATAINNWLLEDKYAFAWPMLYFMMLMLQNMLLIDMGLVAQVRVI
jgi:hypothetical protein